MVVPVRDTEKGAILKELDERDRTCVTVELERRITAVERRLQRRCGVVRNAFMLFWGGHHYDLVILEGAH